VVTNLSATIMTESRQAYVNRTEEINRKKQEQVSSIALGETAKYCAITTSLAAIATFVASKRSTAFNKAMSTSAKVSLPVMTGLFTFGLVSELTIHSVNRDPEKYGLGQDGEKSANRNKILVEKQFYVPFHHVIANRIAGIKSMLVHSCINFVTSYIRFVDSLHRPSILSHQWSWDPVCCIHFLATG
jgi:hypothetical protein